MSEGELWVDFNGNPTEAPLRARVLTGYRDWTLGGIVALMFQEGDTNKPVVIGPVEEIVKDDPSIHTANAGVADVRAREPLQPEDEVTLAANQRVTIRCGESSITLTKAGKIIIRGKYILSRSAGVNRIKGGAVQIN